MKRIITLTMLLLAVGTVSAQQVASRAKAMRMMSFSRPEYQIKDIKVYTDTMTVYSLASYIIYPFGEWSSVEQYITDNQLSWYREIGYQKYYDSMEVSVNRMKRYDDSYIDLYYSIWTKKVELLGGYIRDPEVTLENGVHVGMTKDEVFKVFFKKYPKSYTSDVAVLKVISGAGEVAEIYTFKGQKLRHIKIETAYKYY
ncbi:MAG: hypothetical protein IKX32_02150 [Bacteroidales bacterium]|nr:hypothetical protein [Bacteroidales bacterium]MBR5092259.1 hypothetical protein [Bacteroidales bacterium]